MSDNGGLEGLSRRNRFNMDWTDQVPVAVAPLNSVPYMGPPFDLSGQNALLNHPTMVHLPESTTVEELNKILSFAKKRISVSDNDGGFLFCVTLPGVEKNERFKYDVQEAMSSGEKKGHSHNMMHTCRPPWDLSYVDPRRNRSNMEWADQAPISVAPLNSVPYTGPPFDSSKNQPLNRTTMLILDESTTVEEVNQILSIKGLVVEGGAASDLLGPLIGAYDISDNDDGFFFRVALPGVEKNESKYLDVNTTHIYICVKNINPNPLPVLS